MENVIIECEGKVFVKDRKFTALTLEELIDLCESLYERVEDLEEEIRDIENDIEDNYIPISKAEQYGISDRDFI